MIHLNATSQVLAKSETAVTCPSGSSNPISSIVWRKGGAEMKSGVIKHASDGEYGGKCYTMYSH